MPTVPDSDNLGYSPVGALPQVRATPADFGSQIGAAADKVGGDLAQAGQVADQVIDRNRKLSVNNTLNGFIADAHSVTSGDPNNPNDPGYYGQMGQNAVNGRASAFKSLNDAYNARLNSLQDPIAKAQFEADGRRYLSMTQASMDDHYERESKSALIGSAQATQTLALQGGAIAANNDPLWDHNFQLGLNAAKNEVAARGGTQVEVQAAQQNYTEQAKAQRVQALMGQGLIQQAQTYLQANATDFKPATLEALNNALTPKVRAQQASMTAGNALAAADQGYSQYLNQKSATGQPVGPSAQDVSHAIFMQESTGNPAVGNSVDGAQGGMQIMPATFQQFARPGESINNPADNQAVGQRIIGKYMQDYGGDPARAAVAYFSGPGNVAPPGSPTPYKTDATDGNGKTTSSYVSDVLGRLGGANGIQSKADYYKANFADIIDKTRQQATVEHSDDPQFADLAVARTESQMNAAIRQQELSYAADRDTVLRAVNGDLAKNIRPQSVDQLTSMGPSVSQAWDRLTQNQPEVAHEVATRLVTDNARTGGKDEQTYGPSFFSVFNAIHAPDGTPGKITDPSQLYGMVGQPNGLTMAGLTKAREELAGKTTPDGEAEAAMRAELFKGARGQLTGADDGMGLKDPQGESIYLRWMANTYPAIQALKNAGKTPTQIYSPDSPDYVGKNIASFKRSPAQIAQDMTSANGDVTAPATPAAQPGFVSRLFGSAPAEPDLTTPAGIKKAYLAGNLSRQAAMSLLSGGAPAPAALPPAKTE